ncbi:3-hydroxyacyl-CoA dehydrogenase [Aestuariicella hydrocarbonica]|uniref:3-hydroxyacyl-CoA dehydrogenase n=2 Tax=Pseudomaricurvus hydrocarbonicus TaxID=1470433 RepID=A0A9E5JYT4_9GAMM|nr:3-hydroxyacyl-CoA dehydrogenase NAD-binding domain-containing protein [Aestuariicella hydrocarbonica]NHO64742.1 3-hydroxyacyl-CoA dehydrogenase [Aestuariicella hydrocarbonica]
MTDFNYQKDSDGIVTITMDMDGPVNAMNSEYRNAMDVAINRLKNEDGLTGVVIASAKKVFLAGGDLNEIYSMQPGQEQDFFNIAQTIKSQLRFFEKLPVPVVAAINGAAMGGGFEICLACNYRVAINDPKLRMALPEVTLGLLPGAGGIVRLVNMLGLQAALPYLMEAKALSTEKAIEAGILQATVDSPDELLPHAKQWILNNRNNPQASIQAWDTKGFKIPGGKADAPENNLFTTFAAAQLFKKTRGLLPAQNEILNVSVEAARVGFDAALVIESRSLTRLVMSPEAKNMMSTFFFQLNKLNAGASRPEGFDKSEVKKLGVIGAGMMGQGIAYSAAMAGIEVVLKDVSFEAALKGKQYSEKVLAKQVDRGRLTEESKANVLALITASNQDQDLNGCDLIVEAVFEDMALKHKISRSTEQYLQEEGVWASNTSTLPISMLAEGSQKPENFIGLHFFSPVDKMPLVEIICGDKTSDKTLAKAFDFVRKIKKTPIVVNDSPGFFTSRVIITYLDEGIRLLTEGINPVSVDNLGVAIGMPIGPLAIHDETALKLTQSIFNAWRDLGLESPIGDTSIMEGVLTTMIDENHRGGRQHGGGFYEYPQGETKYIWPELTTLYSNSDAEIVGEDIKDRLLFRPTIEALKCLQSGVLRASADGNIGSVMGIGAPTWTGGYIQWVNNFGLQRFIDRCRALEEKYGERFAVPQVVVDALESNSRL